MAHEALMSATTTALDAVNAAMDAAIADRDLVGRHLEFVMDRLITARRCAYYAHQRAVEQRGLPANVQARLDALIQ
jgi:hypothetical protein